jgi:hypothetical protein
VIMIILVECLSWCRQHRYGHVSYNSLSAPSSMVLHKYLLKYTSYGVIGVVERFRPTRSVFQLGTACSQDIISKWKKS